MANAYVYAAYNRSIRDNPIKIGKTIDVASRMKDLTSHSGTLGRFECWTYFAFECEAQALAVEKSVHSQLEDIGARIQGNREFFDGSKFDFSDLIIKTAGALQFPTLSNFHIDTMFQDYAAYVPAAFFFLDNGKLDLATFDEVFFSAYNLLYEMFGQPDELFNMTTLPLGTQLSLENDAIAIRQNYRLPIFAVRALCRWRLYASLDNKAADPLQAFLERYLVEYQDIEPVFFGDDRASTAILAELEKA